MSILLNKDNSSKMGDTPLFHEFKKQASFFLKEKFKSARLAFTDVTPAELMTEEATNGNPWAPDSPTLRSISRAAFELDDYCRIVKTLRKRLLKFGKTNWRASYNSLIVLEHLLTHGPASVAEEFQSDRDIISQMKSFQYIDDRGFNWGLTVRKKAERILRLLEEGHLLKEERDRARKLSREIQGFGSFCQRSTPAQGVLQETSSLMVFGRCNSGFNNHENEENQSSYSNKALNKEAVESLRHQGGIFESKDKLEIESYQDALGNSQMLKDSKTSSKENMTPNKEELHLWNLREESNPLLDCSREDFTHGVDIFIEEDDHPLNSTEKHATASLLSERAGILLGC